MKSFLKFSQFLSWKKKNKWIVIFHRLHPFPIYLKQKTWDTFLIKKDKNLITQLKNQKLVVRSNTEDEEELKSVIEKLEKKFSYTSTLYLVLTCKCNLECKYCPFPKLSKKREILMSPEIVTKGIDLWMRHIFDNFDKKRDYFIIFYGGEPLLNTNTLKCSLKYIEKLKKENKLPRNNLHIIVDTNGILINNKIIRLFRKYNVMVTVGCDGPKKLNDYYRVDNKGKGTFQKVEKAIKLLEKNKIKTFISVSITPHNIFKIKDFSNFFSKYKIGKFGFNILRGKLSVLLNSRINLEEYYTKAANGIISNFREGKEKKYEYQMERKIKAFYEKQFFPIDCGGYGNQLVIQPNGEISNCPFLLNNFGNVKNHDESFRIWNIPVVKKWRKRLPIYNQSCKDCEVISICGGGCPWNVKEVKGNIFKKDDAMCIFTKKVFDFFIWKDKP